MREFKINGVTFIYTPNDKYFYYRHKLSNIGAVPRWVASGYPKIHRGNYKKWLSNFINWNDRLVEILKEVLTQYPE